MEKRNSKWVYNYDEFQNNNNDDKVLFLLHEIQKKKLPGMYSNGIKDNFNPVFAEKYEIFRTNDRWKNDEMKEWNVIYW